MMVENEAQAVVLMLFSTEKCTGYSHFEARVILGLVLASFLNLDWPLSRI